MKTLTLFLALSTPALACQTLDAAADARRAALVPMVEQVAAVSGVKASLLMGVIQHESCFRADAVSSAGARGLMQLMPGTFNAFGSGDPLSPADNLNAGAAYLVHLHERFGRWDLALAAYNAGPSAVSKYGKVPPFAVTRSYVIAVLATVVAIEFSEVGNG